MANGPITPPPGFVMESGGMPPPPPGFEMVSPFAQTPGGAVTGFGPSRPVAPKGMSIDSLPIVNKDTMEGTADFSTLTKAAMVDDPQTKLRIFARARFPNLPEPEAMARYGMVGDDVVYLGEDDKLYLDTPKGWRGWLKRAGAGLVGAPGATIGATAGGIIGAPAGPAASAGLSALGGAGGKGIDKVIGNLAFDEPQTVTGNLKAMGTEGAFSAGGSLIGSGVGKFLERNLARDISRMDTVGTQEITDKASRIGVDLNPAQATNLPSLKAKVDVLASMPTSRDIIAEGAKKQAGQAYTAADRFLKGVSPREGLDEAGMAARDAAKNVINMIVKERADAAKPLYDAAFERFGGVPAKQVLPETSEAAQKLIGRFRKSGSTNPVADALAEAEKQGFPNVAQNLRAYQDAIRANQIAGIFEANAKSLMNRPAMQEAGKKAVFLAKNEGIDLADPKNSLIGMHYTKMALDDMIEGAGQQGLGGTYRRQLVNLKNQLLQTMDDLSPDYAEARKVFSHFSPNVNSVREGIVSKLADMGDETTHKAAQMVFGGNLSPKTVERTRELFFNAGLKDDWDALLRGYLQSTFEKAGKQFQTAGGQLTQAPRWQVAMTGDPKQLQIIKASMEPGQFKAFTDMMDVFEALGRTANAGAGSQTMTRQEGANLLRRESGAGVIGQAAGLLSPQSIGSRVGNFLQEVRLGNHAEKLAEIMTSTDGMARLRELKKLSPNDKRLIQGVSSLFGVRLSPGGAPARENSQQ